MSESTSRGRSSKQEGQRKAKKKNYVSPKLVEYGALAELTMGAFTKGNDADSGFMK